MLKYQIYVLYKYLTDICKTFRFGRPYADKFNSQQNSYLASIALHEVVALLPFSNLGVFGWAKISVQLKCLKAFVIFLSELEFILEELEFRRLFVRYAQYAKRRLRLL